MQCSTAESTSAVAGTVAGAAAGAAAAAAQQDDGPVGSSWAGQQQQQQQQQPQEPQSVGLPQKHDQLKQQTKADERTREAKHGARQQQSRRQQRSGQQEQAEEGSLRALTDANSHVSLWAEVLKPELTVHVLDGKLRVSDEVSLGQSSALGARTIQFKAAVKRTDTRASEMFGGRILAIYCTLLWITQARG
eukprot:1158920-Pelagomonas_calceolata.AAC.12